MQVIIENDGHLMATICSNVCLGSVGKAEVLHDSK